AVEGPKQKGYLEHLFPSPFMTQHSSLIDKFLLQMGCVTRRARVGRCAHMGSRPAAEACGGMLHPHFLHKKSTNTPTRHTNTDTLHTHTHKHPHTKTNTNTHTHTHTHTYTHTHILKKPHSHSHQV